MERLPKGLPYGEDGEVEGDYSMDYFVYSASSSLSEEQELWDYPLYEVVKRMILKKFDGWVEWKLYEK